MRINNYPAIHAYPIGYSNIFIGPLVDSCFCYCQSEKFGYIIDPMIVKQQRMKTMNKPIHVWRKIKVAIAVLALFLLNILCYPLIGSPDNDLADVEISGTITDIETGEGLPGATVIETGTSNGTVTDFEGKFALTVDENSSITVSFVGYTPKTVEVNGRSSINISLENDIQALSEVVVVGYGTQDKRVVTGSISTVGEEAIKSIPTSNPLQSMQGFAAGVDISNSSSGGRPGDNAQIRIRGNRSLDAKNSAAGTKNNPLFILDGIPLTDGVSSIQDINPQDIASVEVLKDAASTAIYGSRGSNGVVIITTKRGEKGKTVINYNGYYGISTPVQTIDMMNGSEFADLKRESRRNGWNGTIPTDAEIFEPVELESIALGRSTDYQDLLIENGKQTEHNISLRGGAQSTQYALSLGYFDQTALIPDQQYQRLTLRLNLDHKINEKIKVGSSSLTTLSLRNWGSRAAWNEAITNNPLGVPYDEDGNLIFLPTSDGIRTNPLSELVEGVNVTERRTARIFNSVFGEAEIIEGLKYRLNVGTDIRIWRDGEFNGSETFVNRQGAASASLGNTFEFGYTVENILTYDKTFGMHDLRVTALQSIQKQRTENSGLSASNFPYESQQFYNLGSAATPGTISSSLSEWSLASFMGRVNYEIGAKYLFQATLRADGSSRLSEENRWKYFPGFSAGWRLIEEDFIPQSKLLDELKLRVSYGSVGSTSIPPYETQGRLARRVYSWDETSAFGFGLSDIPNTDLTWEVSTTTDAGLDFGFFGGKILGSFDWYQTNTTDILLERVIPLTSGYTSVLQNIGETKNTGVELSLTARIIDKQDGFKWNANFNISRNREEIVELALKDSVGNSIDDVGNEWFIGEPINVYFDYKKAGIYQANEVDEASTLENKVPGEIKLTDTNGDGLITPDDRVVLGSTVPDFYGGLTNRFEFKGIDLSFFLYFKVGHMIQSNIHNGYNQLQGRYNNLDVDYWTVFNPSNEAPRPNENQTFAKNGSTMTYFDGSFLKLRNVTIGYTLPAPVIEWLKISSCRIYFTGHNLWYTSRYQANDPETTLNSGSYRYEVGVGAGPASRLFLTGINVTF